MYILQHKVHETYVYKCENQFSSAKKIKHVYQQRKMNSQSAKFLLQTSDDRPGT